MPDTRDVRVQFYANRLLWGLAGIAGKVTLTKRTFEHTPSRLFAGLRPGLFPEFRTVSVTLDDDYRGIRIEDDGRGIPVGKMKKIGKPALEVILTTLHAGGKFDGESYDVSGGLHGVGSSVVNALSDEMTVWICRDGYEWTQQYARGKVATKLKKLKATRKRLDVRCRRRCPCLLLLQRRHTRGRRLRWRATRCRSSTRRCWSSTASCSGCTSGAAAS